ncbi:Inactive LRR receptor-like serine/threonine-protein kinase BIR2 [Citrus sinensis]|nr:Inactive LRR receptor-like serine/threonine-protein kinase BIR2 [Citrus sinensis]
MIRPVHFLSYLKFITLILVTTQISFPSFTPTATAEDDVKCLAGIKSFNHPQGRLSSWSLTNSSVGFICRFNRVSCWNGNENRILSLELEEMNLSGQIPESLQSCKSLQVLNLSTNNLFGKIPAQLCKWLPYLVSLDLSNNDLSAYNNLSGRIPSFFNGAMKMDMLADSRLGGANLGSKCCDLSKKKLAAIIAAGAFGAAPSLMLVFGLWLWNNLTRVSKRRKRGYEFDDCWVERLGAHKLVEVSLFLKPLIKLKLVHLVAATSKFSAQNVLVSTWTGTTYKAMLLDGSMLAIKRLSASEEKPLVYKYMSNGTLYSLLHSNGNTALDWPSRLRIGLGAARGLSWLHHCCHPPCLHQNISSSVILVDEDFDARIMDFGFSRLTNGDASLQKDVHGFGVVLLELVTGQKPFEINASEEGYKGNLVNWIDQLSSSGRIKDVIDKALTGKGYDDEILQFLQIASVAEVDVNCLEGIKSALNDPQEMELHKPFNSIEQSSWNLWK